MCAGSTSSRPMSRMARNAVRPMSFSSYSGVSPDTFNPCSPMGTIGFSDSSITSACRRNTSLRMPLMVPLVKRSFPKNKASPTRKWFTPLGSCFFNRSGMVTVVPPVTQGMCLLKRDSMSCLYRQSWISLSCVGMMPFRQFRLVPSPMMLMWGSSNTPA